MSEQENPIGQAICVECVHYLAMDSIKSQHRCTRPEMRHRVTGSYGCCEDARRSGGWCGVAGQFFTRNADAVATPA